MSFTPQGRIKFHNEEWISFTMRKELSFTQEERIKFHTMRKELSFTQEEPDEE